MQPTVAGKSTALSSDESIKFRPSPNFKHMKKYLKSKFEESNAANDMSESLGQLEQEKDKNTPTTMIQPPLPPNSPPPDSPVTIKQEIINDEYQSSPKEESLPADPLDELMQQSANPPASGEPEPNMCRNFIRGTCKKGAACIFQHRLIISQLPGVYTFCRNFQNKQCGYAKCKFVHATVFEKENFYRTGYLPPHTTAHLKQLPVSVAPPLPPPLPPAEESQIVPQIMPQVFSNAPTYDLSVPAVPALGCATLPTLTANAPEVFQFGVADITTSPLKREWTDTEDFSRSPPDPDSGEPPAKKCDSCDTNKFRYQYNKNKVQELMVSAEERKKRIAQINKKYQRLCTVLMSLFKPTGSPSTSNVLGSPGNVGIDKEKGILDSLEMMLGGNKTPHFPDENIKHFLANMKF